MNYYKIIIPATEESMKEVLTALLSELEFEGFEDGDDHFYAYIPESLFDAPQLEETLAGLELSYTRELIAQQNWNAQWESDFQPVIVEGFCTIVAGFHNIAIDTPYKIVVTPKMSFGTGHHATTQLMIGQMRDIDFAGKRVLDFGTGTGILAILAEMLGAQDVLAIDNDEWSFENARENAVTNDARQTTVQIGSLEIAKGGTYDVILANINRHILLHYMSGMYALLPVDGVLLMSGLLTEDFDIINASATAAGFHFDRKTMLNNWICIKYFKQ